MENARKRLNPLYGIGVFLFVILATLFVFAPLQYAFGMGGLALTELGLLLIALLSTRIFGQSFREVFPVKKPKFGQIAGTILLWAGTYLLVMLTTITLMFFFPEGFLYMSTSMNSTFSSTPPPITFLIVAILPAICEEAVHRGFIQHTFRNVRNDWVVILSMGLIFGIFHLDPYRFLPTALLGIVLTYVMRKSGNLLFPALIHFINNALSAISSFSGSKQALEDAELLLSAPSFLLLSLGSYLLIGCLAPALLYVGRHLFCKSTGCLKKPSDGRLAVEVIIILFLCALMFVAGFAIILLNMGGMMDIQEILKEMYQP